LLDDSLVALGADAVGELGLAVLLDVALDFVPVVAVVAAFFAVAADGQQALQELHVRDGGLKFLNALRELGLTVDHARADLHAGAQFLLVEGIGDVVIRAGVEALDDVGLAATNGEQDEVKGESLSGGRAWQQSSTPSMPCICQSMMARHGASSRWNALSAWSALVVTTTSKLHRVSRSSRIRLTTGSSSATRIFMFAG
jgi:hypothetical protein